MNVNMGVYLPKQFPLMLDAADCNVTELKLHCSFYLYRTEIGLH